MSARNGTSELIALLAFGATLCGCARSASKATAPYATYQYSCCQAADIAPVRQAGVPMLVHWIATVALPAPARTVTPVTLAATLTGPFPDVAALKNVMSSSHGRPPTIVAGTVQTTDQAGGTPVSTLRLPSSTPAGFYDLTTTVTSAGGTASGHSVIQVGAGTKTG
jgi:hypothetical protein